MTIHTNATGIWRDASSGHNVNVNGVWREMDTGHTNAGGTWREFYKRKTLGEVWNLGIGVPNGDWSIGYGNGLFVAVTKGATTQNIMWSSNGINWTLISSFSTKLGCITYGNNQFVALGGDFWTNGVIYTSSANGTTWTTGTNNTNPGGAFHSICYAADKGRYVAVGGKVAADGGTYASHATSLNATIWSNNGLNAGGGYNYMVDLQGVCYGNGLFVACCSAYNYSIEGRPFSIDSTLTSTDGSNWTTYPANTNGVAGQPRSICYAPDKNLFVMVGYNGEISVSSNGLNWTMVVSPSTTLKTLNSIAYGDGVFVAVGWSGTVITSPDGVNWMERSGITSSNLTDVCYGDGKFVAIGRGTSIVSQ